jgi:hypothetical protein
MRFAVGLLCVAACATKPAPVPQNVQTVVKEEREVPRETVAPRGRPGARPRVAQLTPEVVLETIRGRYIAGVERCYRRHLKKDAGARGRVLVSFTVDPKGHARDGDARGVTEQVDECITAQVQRWRFPVPRHHAEAHFALGLELGAN